jgi:hypothetical protein
MDLKKELSGVADAVTKIMDEALKGSQHKIDANKNNKIDAHDFKLLRAKKEVKKEDVESVEEGYYKNMDTNRKEDERLAAKKKKDTLPFTPDKPKAKVATPGKFGYGYSAARHLARQGMAGMTKEEREFIDELNKSTLGSYINKSAKDAVDRTAQEVETGEIDKMADKRMKGIKLATKKLAKEETDQVEEDIQKTSTGYIHHARPGVYGGSAKEKHVVDTLRGPKKSEIEAIEKEKKMKKFSEMLDLINSQGLKALSEMIKEEPDNEQFTKELKDQEAKAAGKKKQADIAKGSVQAVKVEEDVEQIDELSKDTLASYVNRSANQAIIKGLANPKHDSDDMKTIDKREKGIRLATSKLAREETEQVEERSLTEPEMKKKEEIVKSMKKGLAGFKSRYGDRAKEVMYATATKQAKGE